MTQVEYNMDSLHSYMVQYFDSRSQIMSYEDNGSDRFTVTVNGFPNSFSLNYSISLREITITKEDVVSVIEVLYNPFLGWLGTCPYLSDILQLENVLDGSLMAVFGLREHGFYLEWSV